MGVLSEHHGCGTFCVGAPDPCFPGWSLCFSAHRCRGSFLLGRVQLRVNRRKPPRVPRKDRRPPPLEGLDPRRTLGRASSEMAGDALPGGSKRHQLLGMQGEQQTATLALRSPKSRRDTEDVTQVCHRWDSQRDPKLVGRVLGGNPISRRRQTSSSTGHVH